MGRGHPCLVEIAAANPGQAGSLLPDIHVTGVPPMRGSLPYIQVPSVPGVRDHGQDPWRPALMHRFTKGNTVNVGRVRPPSVRAKLSASKMGERNPNWRGDSICEDSGRDRAWRWFASPATCGICGKETKTERHHKDGNTLNNAPSNIAFLCRRCHMLADGRLQAFLAFDHTLDQKRPRPPRLLKTHCLRGHEYTPENTFIDKAHRFCRACRNRRMRLVRERARNENHAC